MYHEEYDNLKCECGNPARYQCDFCSEGFCQGCLDDPTSPATRDWHDTGWVVCSYDCEEKAIDGLVEDIQVLRIKYRNLQKAVREMRIWSHRLKAAIHHRKRFHILLGRLTNVIDSTATQHEVTRKFWGKGANYDTRKYVWL